MKTYELVYIKKGFDGQGDPYSIKVTKEFDFKSEVNDFIDLNKLTKYKIYLVERTEIG